MDKDFKAHLDARFDRLEDKLDDHLVRLTKAESAIDWLRGHVKITTAIGMSVMGTIAAWWFSYVTGS